MKHIYFILVIIFSIVGISSCQKYNAFDVEEVVFPKEGGTVTINNWTAMGCIISDERGSAFDHSPYICYPLNTSSSTDPLKTTFTWLTAEYLTHTQLQLTAAPNDTGKSRKLRLEGAVQNHPSYIWIIQK